MKPAGTKDGWDDSSFHSDVEVWQAQQSLLVCSNQTRLFLRYFGIALGQGLMMKLRGVSLKFGKGKGKQA